MTKYVITNSVPPPLRRKRKEIAPPRRPDADQEPKAADIRFPLEGKDPA